MSSTHELTEVLDRLERGGVIAPKDFIPKGYISPEGQVIYREEYSELFRALMGTIDELNG